MYLRNYVVTGTLQFSMAKHAFYIPHHELVNFYVHSNSGFRPMGFHMNHLIVPTLFCLYDFPYRHPPHALVVLVVSETGVAHEKSARKLIHFVLGTENQLEYQPSNKDTLLVFLSCFQN